MNSTWAQLPPSPTVEDAVPLHFPRNLHVSDPSFDDFLSQTTQTLPRISGGLDFSSSFNDSPDDSNTLFSLSSSSRSFQLSPTHSPLLQRSSTISSRGSERVRSLSASPVPSNTCTVALATSRPCQRYPRHAFEVQSGIMIYQTLPNDAALQERARANANGKYRNQSKV